jgi:hypothetical protein
LRIPRGSNASLTAAITSISSGERVRCSHRCLATPTPCSALIEPPNGERSLAADQELPEVVAGVVLEQAGETPDDATAADSAKRVVGLMDSTKFERSSLMTIRSAAALDLIITDDRLDPAVAGAFRAAGVNLQVVSGVAEAGDAEAD